MNVDLTDKICKDIRNYVGRRSDYNPRVVAKSLKQLDKFPLITVTKEDDQNDIIDTTYRETADKLYFMINIYAQDKAIGNATISNKNIVSELERLVDEVMRRKYRMKRISCKPTPNLDDTIYRKTIKYAKEILANRNILY